MSYTVLYIVFKIVECAEVIVFYPNHICTYKINAEILDDLSPRLLMIEITGIRGSSNIKTSSDDDCSEGSETAVCYLVGSTNSSAIGWGMWSIAINGNVCMDYETFIRTHNTCIHILYKVSVMHITKHAHTVFTLISV